MSTVATFVSPTNNLRLIHEPRRRRMNENGEIVETAGVTFEFRNGQLEVTTDSVGGRPVEDASAVLDWLRNHTSNGVYFHELGAERGSGGRRTEDDPSEVIKEIARRAATGDLDGVADIYVAERASYGRPLVLAAAEAAIEAHDGEVPAPPPTPEHEVERVRREPAVGAHVPPVDHPQPENLGQPEGESPDEGYVGEVESPPTGGAPVDETQAAQAEGQSEGEEPPPQQ